MNFADFTAKLENVSDDIAEDVIEATREVAAEMLAAAQERAPVVSGELRDSGRVVDAQDGAQVEFTAEYAAEVHENPESEGFRFLESVIDERSGALPDDIAAKVDL